MSSKSPKASSLIVAPKVVPIELVELNVSGSDDLELPGAVGERVKAPEKVLVVAENTLVPVKVLLVSNAGKVCVCAASNAASPKIVSTTRSDFFIFREALLI